MGALILKGGFGCVVEPLQADLQLLIGNFGNHLASCRCLSRAEHFDKRRRSMRKLSITYETSLLSTFLSYAASRRCVTVVPLRPQNL